MQGRPSDSLALGCSLKSRVTSLPGAWCSLSMRITAGQCLSDPLVYGPLPDPRSAWDAWTYALVFSFIFGMLTGWSGALGNPREPIPGNWISQK
ncbi:hypothetical protein NDU88_000615 [Pleurodeles waltl]|uniref:Uncharacterized protein n=1 Tax=Pleurodeles waltl TaxID=8319 RepID=A0AAV7P3C2_PLEWA|nr:hypothetical protein NDU88_000615 [Pleurodeles waltl]